MKGKHVLHVVPGKDGEFTASLDHKPTEWEKAKTEIKILVIFSAMSGSVTTIVVVGVVDIIRRLLF